MNSNNEEDHDLCVTSILAATHVKAWFVRYSDVEKGHGR